MKQWLMTGIYATLASASGLYNLQYSGVDSLHTNGDVYHIEREVPAACLDIPISNSAIWEGSFASDEVPDTCKASFARTVGVVSPMVIAKGVETYGELEVMHFIREMNKEGRSLLVDTRGAEWYEYETIPGAINFWFAVLIKPEVFPEEYKEMLEQMGVKVDGRGRYDFSSAATLLLFCNGPWCGQSPTAIRKLLEIGYPPEKIKWYRGGMHAWKSLSMTTTRSY